MTGRLVIIYTLFVPYEGTILVIFRYHQITATFFFFFLTLRLYLFPLDDQDSWTSNPFILALIVIETAESIMQWFALIIKTAKMKALAMLPKVHLFWELLLTGKT